MDHVKKIAEYLKVVAASRTFHLFLVKGLPGWGKTTAVQNGLRRAGIRYYEVGSYCTPLQLFNHLWDRPRDFALIDDTAGILTSDNALSILNAATWAQPDGERRVTWSNANGGERTPGNRRVVFSGKIIILTNGVPSKQAAAALLSRGLAYEIPFDVDLIPDLLIEAAQETRFYPDSSLGHEVAEFIIEQIPYCDCNQINYRKLQLGYELATQQPEQWRELLPSLLPKNPDLDLDQLVVQLHQCGRSVKEQIVAWARATGRCERSFKYRRQRLGLGRSRPKGNAVSHHDRRGRGRNAGSQRAEMN